MSRFTAVAIGLVLLASATTWAAGAPSANDTQPLTGRRLVLTDVAGAVRQIAARSIDPAITLGAGNGSVDDPTGFGASLRVRTTTGDGFDTFYQLPKTAWHLLGRPGDNRGYRFRSRTGPILSAVVRPGRQITLKGKGALGHTLATNPAPIDVVLEVGARRYCMEFGGTVTFAAQRRLRAMDAPAPTACPALVDWPTYGFDLARSRFNPQEGLLDAATVGALDVRWFFPTGPGVAAVSASPTVVDGAAYVGAWNGTMYALDAFSGLPLWTFDIADPHPEARSGFPGIQSSAAVAGGRVFFGAADANVYALDAQSGALDWRTPLGDPDPTVEGAHVWASPAVFDGKVYVGKSSHFDQPCVRGALFALDAATGDQVWRFDMLPELICGTDTRHPCATDADCPGTSCVPFLVCRSGSGEQAQSVLCASDADCTAPATCQQPLGGGITSSPAIDPATGTVYVSVGDCVGAGATGFAESVVALDAQTGTPRWSFQPLAPGDLNDFDFVASPNVFSATVGAVPRRLVWVRNKNGVYYAVDQDTGAPVWQQTVVAGTALGGFNASTGVALGRIFAGTFTGPPFEFALDASDGSTAWQCPGTECTGFSFGPPAIAGGVVLIGDGAGKLRAFDAQSGALLRKIDLGGGISSGPAVANGMVIVGAGTGGFGASPKQGVYGLALP
jgi:polyvinyl alcohol dehydrogenase (cytochrome)